MRFDSSFQRGMSERGIGDRMLPLRAHRGDLGHRRSEQLVRRRIQAIARGGERQHVAREQVAPRQRQLRERLGDERGQLRLVHAFAEQAQRLRRRARRDSDSARMRRIGAPSASPACCTASRWMAVSLGASITRPCARCGRPARSIASAQSSSSSLLPRTRDAARIDAMPPASITARRPLIASFDSASGGTSASTYFAIHARSVSVVAAISRRVRSTKPARSGERFRQRAAAADQREAIGGAQVGQRGQLDHVRESIRERRIERQRALVRVVRIGVGRDRRVHRRPAVAELRQREPLHALLVDHREELVLRLGAAARDLVEEHALARPTGRPACAGTSRRCA